MGDDATHGGPENLLHSARAGDAASTAEIDRIVRTFARGLCGSSGPGGGAAFDWEDVAQEAAQRLLAAGFRQYRGAGSDRSYLYAVVKTTYIQMCRTVRRRRVREEALMAAPDPGPPDPMRRIDVRGILERLEADCRALIVRALFRDESYAALARELGISDSALRSRLHRCLEKARRIAAGGDGS